MKRFTQFIRESPHETDNPVSVSTYFALAPDTTWQAIAPKIIAAVKAGELIAQRQETPIASITPTQDTVSLTKVQKYAASGTIELAPGIALHTETALFLLDGHHRASADALNGLIQTPTRVLSIQQINDWLST
jgi:hypothetical protein